jgi:hypothetical protein
MIWDSKVPAQTRGILDFVEKKVGVELENAEK